MSINRGVSLTGAGTIHPEYKRFEREWTTIADCIAGQPAVKRQGEEYLPKPEAWSEKRYKAYLNRAHFLNATYRTSVGMTGIAFNKPATYSFDGEMVALLNNCDGEGLDLDQMVRDGVTENITYGRGGVLVDHTNGSNEARTIANAGRVVLRLFCHDQIINWRVSNGRLVMLVLRYKEDVDHDGFEHYQVTRYLEYRLIDGRCHVRLWSDQTYSNLPAPVVNYAPDEMSALTPVLAGGKILDRIPFCWFGSMSNDPAVDPAPLADIANTNIAHYQSDADVSDSAFIAGQPTLIIAGVSQQWAKENPNVMMGAGEGVVLSSGGGGSSTPTASILTAPANTQSAALMDKREKQLAMLGAKLIERNGATKTATQAGNDAQTDNSILSQCVGNVEAAFNQAFEFTKMYISGDGSVSINKRYDEATADSQAFSAYMGAVQAGMMRFKDFLAWQQRNGLISNDEDIDDVERELDSVQNTPAGVLSRMEKAASGEGKLSNNAASKDEADGGGE